MRFWLLQAVAVVGVYMLADLCTAPMFLVSAGLLIRDELDVGFDQTQLMSHLLGACPFFALHVSQLVHFLLLHTVLSFGCS